MPEFRPYQLQESETQVNWLKHKRRNVLACVTMKSRGEFQAWKEPEAHKMLARLSLFQLLVLVLPLFGFILSHFIRASSMWLGTWPAKSSGLYHSSLRSKENESGFYFWHPYMWFSEMHSDEPHLIHMPILRTNQWLRGEGSIVKCCSSLPPRWLPMISGLSVLNTLGNREQNTWHVMWIILSWWQWTPSKFKKSVFLSLNCLKDFR